MVYKLRITSLVSDITNSLLTLEIHIGFKSRDVNSDLFLFITPLLIYSNADIEKVAIFKNNRGKAGVYC